MNSRRERITREILRHIDGIMADKDLDVAAMSAELRDFLRPLTLNQVKAVVIAAARSDSEFWEKFGAALELVLLRVANAPAGDEHGMGQLVGDALDIARREVDEKLERGLRVLKGGAQTAA